MNRKLLDLVLKDYISNKVENFLRPVSIKVPNVTVMTMCYCDVIYSAVNFVCIYNKEKTC